MPNYLRYFYLKCLIEQKQKETKEAEDSQNKPAGKAPTKRIAQKPY
jgi:hypothetical protein